ncbi:ribonuclease HII [Phaeocystis globosa virus 14T]|nr:ribonuclease HII [Phaeocystis globosa virus 14T]
MPKHILEQSYNPESKLSEIGIDEVGRGPMFGRVYTAAVILPKNTDFKYELMKDSKKFTSKKKLMKPLNILKNTL